MNKLFVLLASLALFQSPLFARELVDGTSQAVWLPASSTESFNYSILYVDGDAAKELWTGIIVYSPVDTNICGIAGMSFVKTSAMGCWEDATGETTTYHCGQILDNMNGGAENDDYGCGGGRSGQAVMISKSSRLARH